MVGVLADLGSVITTIMTSATGVVSFIVASPILLIPFAFGLIGGAVALFKKLKKS